MKEKNIKKKADKKNQSPLKSELKADPNKKFELSDVIEKVYPKKTLNAYMFFSLEKRNEIILKSPDKKITEISAIIG